MDLLSMLVELPLHGFHRRCRVPGQPRSANRKVFVATGALAVQRGFVVLGDLKMWFFHASSMAQSVFQFQIAKIRTVVLPKKGGEVKNWKESFTIELCALLQLTRLSSSAVLSNQANYDCLPRRSAAEPCTAQLSEAASDCASISASRRPRAFDAHGNDTLVLFKREKSK
jgi:hypothetical protein